MFGKMFMDGFKAALGVFKGGATPGTVAKGMETVVKAAEKLEKARKLTGGKR